MVQEDGSMEALKGFEAAANASGLEYTVLEALDEGNDTKREMKRSIGASELERQSHIQAWERYVPSILYHLLFTYDSLADTNVSVESDPTVSLPPSFSPPPPTGTFAYPPLCHSSLKPFLPF